MENNTDFWRKCSSCKNPIQFKSKYYICSVSTCNGQRTGYVFCSMPCFERHLPGARHRDAAAVEKESPPSAGAPEGRRILVSNSPTPQGTYKAPAAPREILIVASKLKDYIRAKSEFNTSGAIMETLSDFVRDLCDEAIDRARREGRKTVLERDFQRRDD